MAATLLKGGGEIRSGWEIHWRIVPSASSRATRQLGAGSYCSSHLGLIQQTDLPRLFSKRIGSLKVGAEPGPERGIHETHAPKESKTGMWSGGWAGPGEVVAKGEIGNPWSGGASERGAEERGQPLVALGWRGASAAAFSVLVSTVPI